MRIISGKYRGRQIPVPPGFRARPTTDFAREGLFNILSNTWELEGVEVLDLYAGTGSIGFEFASRGAANVDMVEIDHKSIRFLNKAVEKLGDENIRIIRSDAMDFISHVPLQYDIVFADPPYDLEILPEIPDRVFEANILTEKGWFILEHGKKNTFASHQNFLEIRKYGSVHFSLFT